MRAGASAAVLDEAADVTHSTAFNVLDTLVEEGFILDQRANYLKQKFKDLHTRVLTIYKRDNMLLKRARQLRAELDRERSRVQSRGEVAKKDDEEIQRLKHTLVALEKELNDSQERESILQVEALEYDRRKQNLILEREDAQAAEEARLRPKMEAVQADIGEMGNAVKALVEQHGELQATLDKVAQDEALCRAEAANFTATLAQRRQLFSNVEHEPERAGKQLQLVTRSLAAAQQELTTAEKRAAALAELASKLEQQMGSRSADMAAAQEGLQRVKTDIETRRKTLAALSTSLEMELEARQGYQDRLNELDQLTKSTRIAAKQEEDAVERVQREKTRSGKEFATLEKAREDFVHEQRALDDQLTTLQKAVEQVEATRRQVRAKIAGSRKQVDSRARQLVQEQSKEKAFTEAANALLADMDDVQERIHEMAELDEVRRHELLALLSRRQEMNRAAAREASRAVLARAEVSSKGQQLHELRHRRGELDRRLGALMESFQMVKRERSHKTALIQAITQKMTEVAEKTKILENELEVLVRESALKEQELLKKKRQTHEAQRVVAKLRLEKEKFRKKMELALDAEKEVRSQVRRMNLDVAATEDVMASLRATYVSAVESRNQTGVQLVDRNDTLSLLVEKVRAQEAAIELGTSITNARADELKRLKVLLADLLRAIQVCQKSIPKVSQLEEELRRVTSDIEDERWRFEVLEKELTDPNNPHRWRMLPAPKDTAATATVSATGAAPATTTTTTHAAGGAGAGITTTAGPEADGSPPSEAYSRLQTRTQDLESRINAINARLREKELILAEVRDLSDRIGTQAETGREFSLALARQMNQYQGGIRAKTRQMMATVSELSLFQASSIQLQQEVARLEGVVTEAEQRLEAGEAPFAEAEEEYVRQRVSNCRYAEATAQRREEAAAAALMGPSTVITTAVPRPTAYVPSDGLGLPRPYGAHAPFRPNAAPAATAPLRACVRPGPGRTEAAGAVAAPSPAVEMVAVAAGGRSGGRSGPVTGGAKLGGRGVPGTYQVHGGGGGEENYSRLVPVSDIGSSSRPRSSPQQPGGAEELVSLQPAQLRLSQRYLSSTQ